VEGEEKTLRAVYEIITIQRDFGNRSDRKQARLKYTLDRMGVEEFKAELERRCGFALEPERPYAFTQRRDDYGWYQNHEGKWYYTVFAENGRVLDDEKLALKTALLEVARTGLANFRFTCNQNVIISDILPENRPQIEEILNRFGIIEHTERAGAVRKSAIACVAYNTCPLALAEAQRYLPTLITKLEPVLEKHGLSDDEISLRMTGCPNGCGRPYAAEIGLIGTAYGQYNLHIGGDRNGYRLNKKYRENLDEPAILNELDSLLGTYSRQRNAGETFGDFAIRNNWV
jgi:sulfite reductase (NADPH) hemoprotein beta-component